MSDLTKGKCTWDYDDLEVSEDVITECGDYFSFVSGRPVNYKWCPYCGRLIYFPKETIDERNATSEI